MIDVLFLYTWSSAVHASVAYATTTTTTTIIASSAVTVIILTIVIEIEQIDKNDNTYMYRRE
jgi:hypothetical protein